MHRPAKATSQAVNRPRAIKNTTSPVVVYTKVHWLPISVAGKDDGGEDRYSQQDLLGRRVAKHAPSLATGDH